MLHTDKILSPEKLSGILECRRNCGLTVVLAHGCFDILHVGHVRHLTEACRLGKVLVVTVTPDCFVDKGPGRPIFKELIRAEVVAALQCVDYVSISHWDHPYEIIKLLRPNVYVKGPDYSGRESDSSGFGLDIQAVNEVGGRVVITRDIEFHSTDILRRIDGSL